MSVGRLTANSHHKTNLRLFVANGSTTHTHFCHMRFCERATDSPIRMEGLVFLKYVASIIGQVPTSCIGGLQHAHNRASKHYCEPQMAAGVALGKAPCD
jgi:hypothetical protein